MGIVYETCILKDAVFCFVFVAVWVYLFSKANYVYIHVPRFGHLTNPVCVVLNFDTV